MIFCPLFRLDMDLDSVGESNTNSPRPCDTPGVRYSPEMNHSPGLSYSPPFSRQYNYYYDYNQLMYYDSMIFNWMNHISMYNEVQYTGSNYAAAPVWTLTLNDIVTLCRMLRDHGYF